MAGGEEKASDAELADAPPFVPAEELKFERELLGVYVSGHPLQSCTQLISSASQVCVRTRKPGAREDAFEFLPFTLATIAKKVEEDDEAEPGAAGDLEGDEAVPAEAPAPDGDDADDATAEEAAPTLSPVDELLMKAADDDGLLKGLARSHVKAKGEVAWSDKKAFDGAVSKERVRFRKRLEKKELEPLLVKKLDVRVVAMMTGCSIKTPKPRPDGSVGEKWAILTLDDGKGQADAFCYAKAWRQFNGGSDAAHPAKIEPLVDKLVMACGEIAHRTNYDKDDVQKANPHVGDLSFTVREVYPLDEVLPLATDGVRIRLRYADPELQAKFARLKDVALKNPGTLPLFVDLVYADGTTVKIDLGPSGKVACNIAFLSEFAKIVPAADLVYGCRDQIYFAPKEPKPWEM